MNMRKILSFSRPVLPEWAAALCGVTGAGLLLAGVVCFFAYNWAVMGAVSKLVLPLIGLLISAFAAMRTGLQSGAGQVCSFACGIFIGVFWAVYGQIFQTGSFVYEFLAAWAVCLLPLAILACNRWLWLLWACVAMCYVGDFCANSLIAECVNAALALLFFAAFEAVWFKTKRMGWFSSLFLLGVLGVCLLWLCDRASIWTVVALIITCGIGFYAYWARRGALQLGLCALVLDIGIVVHLFDARFWMSWLVGPFIILILTVLSAWGVYMLSRKEARHD